MTLHLAGNVIVINILCGQKRGKPVYPACFVFKSAGTAIGKDTLLLQLLTLNSAFCGMKRPQALPFSLCG